jgi:inner membrane protein
MPTILSHPAVPLALGLGLGRGVIPRRLLVAGVVASDLPDFDVIGFWLRVPYESDYGHRGFTHSLAFAFAVAALGTLGCRWLRARALTTFGFLLVSAASHGLLDTFTDGGHGIALLWPFSGERYFAPLQVIRVSPIGVTGIFSRRGVAVLASELFWVWLPCALVGLGLAAWRRYRASGPPPGGGAAVVNAASVREERG